MPHHFRAWSQASLPTLAFPFQVPPTPPGALFLLIKLILLVQHTLTDSRSR